MKQFFWAYFPYYKDYTGRIFQAFIGMLLASGATAAIAYLVKPVMDEIFVEKNLDMLTIMPIFVILAFVAKGLGTFMQTYALSYIGQDIIRRVRNKLLGHIMSQDLAFHWRYHSGELISRISNDITRIQTAISTEMATLMRESVTVLALFGVVIYQSPTLALYALVIIPVAVYPVEVISKKIKKLSHRSQENNSHLVSSLSEIFNNIEMIQAYNAKEHELGRFAERNLRFFQTNIKTVKVQQMLVPILELVAAIAIAVIIIIGGREVLVSESMSTGQFFSFLTALSLLIDPLRRISSAYNRFQDAIAAHERIEEMMCLESAIQGGEQKESHIHTIRFKEAGLKYGEKTALRGIDLAVDRAGMVGLVGDSGGGKSSMVNLLLRFYDVTGGQMLINGRPCQEFDLQWLREKVALVTQRVYIVNDTVAANIAYGKKIDEAKVEASLKAANLWELVQSLPAGIDTPLQESGSNLSGGQRQRIAIARALYKDPDVLVLDEATSALDNKSEAAVMRTVEALAKERIVFVVAHRLTTVEHARMILVFKEGEIVCRGTLEALKAGCPDFQKLYQSTAGERA